MRIQSLVTKSKWDKYLKVVEKTYKNSIKYNESSLKGDYKVTYKFNENVLNGEKDIQISRKGMKLKGFKKQIKF